MCERLDGSVSVRVHRVGIEVSGRFSGRYRRSCGRYRQTSMNKALNVIQHQAEAPTKEAPTEPFKRAVAGCLRAIARQARARGHLRRRPAGCCRRQGAAARAAAQADARATSRSCAAIGDSMALRLACHDPAVHRTRCARRPAGARGVRRGRAGARRGDRRAAHGGRRATISPHARRPVPPRQVRRDHRPRRCAARGCGRPDGARAPHRPGAAAGGAQARRALAAAGSRSAPARDLDRLEKLIEDQRALRRRRPRPARLARHGRRPQRRDDEEDERGRANEDEPQGRERRGRRGAEVRGRADA